MQAVAASKTVVRSEEELQNLDITEQGNEEYYTGAVQNELAT